MSNPAVIHSKLSFSARKRWRAGACPDSVVLSAGLPDKSSPAAAEGTVAHAVAEFYVRQAFNLPGAVPGDPLDVPVPAGLELKGDLGPELWNEELRKHGRAYVFFIRSLIPEGEQAFVTIEQKVAIPSVSEHLFGTADCIIWIPRLRHLIVVDYKYGFEDVAVGDIDDTNPQLAAYGVAAAETYNLDPLEVGVAVFQPRRLIGSAGDATLMRADLWLPAERRKLQGDVAAVAAATGANPKPGDYCRYCRAAKSTCPVVHETLAAVVGAYVGEKNLHLMEDDEVVQLWAARTAFKAFWEDIEARIDNLAKLGHPRIRIELGTARRKWKREEDVVNTLLALGRSDLLEAKALSKVYDRLPTYIRDELVTTGVPPRSLKLVEPGTPSQVAKLFKKYSNTVDAKVKTD